MSNVLVMGNRRSYRAEDGTDQGATASEPAKPRRNHGGKAKTALKWAGVTVAGAILGTIAVRKYEEYRTRGKKPEALPEPELPQPQAALPPAFSQPMQTPIVVPMPYPMVGPSFGSPYAPPAPAYPHPHAPAAPAPAPPEQRGTAGDRFEEELERLEALQEKSRKARKTRLDRIMREFEEDL
jgi:hypothetical protein